jgi:hypothetical protein
MTNGRFDVRRVQVHGTERWINSNDNTAASSFSKRR